MAPPVRGFVARWRVYLARVGHHQTGILLTLLYVAVVVPIAVLRRLSLRAPLLDIGPTPRWNPRSERPPTVDDLRRMY